MIILAIETSCDETSVAVVKATTVVGLYKFEILSNIVLSQIKIHARWGGVVPSLAKREHQANLIPILKKALIKAKLPNEKGKTQNAKQQLKTQNNIKNILKREPELLKQFLEFIIKIKTPKIDPVRSRQSKIADGFQRNSTSNGIDAIAVTVGPGLEPALWVGINFAKALSLVWNKPIIAVNHMEGHIAASLLAAKSNLKSKTLNLKFPALALLVSGGHTELVIIKKWGDYKIIGETRDDAAGECFDKTARMLGLPYPGGPAIARLALQCKSQTTNHKLQIKLPRPMIDSKDYDFSFSGLKTSVLYLLKDLEKMIPKKSDRARQTLSRQAMRAGRLKLVPFICKKLQQAIIDVLIAKTLRAAKEFKAKTIILGGGVAANKELRKQIKKVVVRELATTTLCLPSVKLTTDNAAMIAAAGYLRAINKEFIEPDKLEAKGNLTFK